VWFRTLRTWIHESLYPANQVHESLVKVAIIGAGVDASHPEIKAALKDKKITEYKGFPKSLDPLCDEQGHGTHGVSVLLRTSPVVSVYGARVVDDNGSLAEMTQVAQVL
jgi:subtilisin family serine protease